jgi:hypothetical protein
MHQIKLFVHKNDIIKLRCPSCLQKIKIPASVLKNKYKLRGKCKCQSIIEVELEYRRSFRKEKNLDGFYSYNSEKLQNVKLLDGDIETKQEDNLSETPKLDISEFKLDPSFSSKRNFLYNLNTRAINLFLFAITAIIASISIFIYFLYLATHE